MLLIKLIQVCAGDDRKKPLCKWLILRLLTKRWKSFAFWQFVSQFCKNMLQLLGSRINSTKIKNFQTYKTPNLQWTFFTFKELSKVFQLHKTFGFSNISHIYDVQYSDAIFSVFYDARFSSLYFDSIEKEIV